MPDWDEAEKTLEAVYRKHYPLLARRGVDDVAADLGRDIDPGDALSHITERIGSRVKGVVSTQRERIQGLVNQYDGNPDGLKAALQEALDTSEKRARVIAISEVTYVLNSSTAVACKTAEANVLIDDGDDDEDCSSVNGTVQTADWLLDNPMGHPNCTRRGYPTDEDVSE